MEHSDFTEEELLKISNFTAEELIADEAKNFAARAIDDFEHGCWTQTPRKKDEAYLLAKKVLEEAGE